MVRAVSSVARRGTRSDREDRWSRGSLGRPGIHAGDADNRLPTAVVNDRIRDALLLGVSHRANIRDNFVRAPRN